MGSRPSAVAHNEKDSQDAGLPVSDHAAAEKELDKRGLSSEQVAARVERKGAKRSHDSELEQWHEEEEDGERFNEDLR